MLILEINFFFFFQSNRDSDEEVDLEALRLAALKSRKNRYGPRVNHRNLIPIVPIAIETSELVEAKIKKEKLSPTSQCTVTGTRSFHDFCCNQNKNNFNN